MRKQLYGLCLLGCTSVAHAQTSITLYGRIDNGIQYEGGLPTGGLVSAQSGDWGCSWFGLLGSEDLGGESKLLFRLEGQIDTMTGASEGSLFGRRATVSLENVRYGTFTLGNLGASELSQDSWAVDPQAMQRYSVVTLVRARNWAMASNGLAYETPAWAGLTLKGQYDLTNNTSWNKATTSTGQGRSDGLEAIYHYGDAHLRVIYDEIRGPNGSFNDVYAHSRSVLAAGRYVFGAVQLYAGYQHLSAPNATNASVGVADSSQPAGVSAPSRVDHEWLGAFWRVNVETGLTAAIYHSHANHGNGNATLYTLGSTYLLSKRTFLYAETGYLHNGATSNIGLSSGPYGNNDYDQASNIASNSNPDYGHSQFGVFAGIMTQF
ncbi:porin protein [Caballeronia arvi]|uniref:Porin protein n=1 Tax=Caballeronia arvi TaxID=1777135 RepID=A0A158J2G8_9BURK|nr:porin [Caballeronia arvi]SAL63074.1 porin protein [Caballeronia arvi]